jgi:hypothetical protein
VPVLRTVRVCGPVNDAADAGTSKTFVGASVAPVTLKSISLGASVMASTTAASPAGTASG